VFLKEGKQVQDITRERSVRKSGRWWVVCGGTVIVIAVTGFLLLPKRAMKLESDQLYHEYDFGFVLPGQVVSHEFELENCFSESLILTDVVERSCGCTTVDIRKPYLVSGDKTLVRVGMSSKLFPTNMAVRAIIKGTVGKEPISITLMLKAVVANLLEIDRQEYIINMGDFSLQDLPKRLILHARKGEYPVAWDTIEAHCTNQMLCASVEKTTEDNWLIIVELADARSIGVLKDHIHIDFFSKGEKLPFAWDRPVAATIRGPVKCEFESLLFGSIGQGENEPPICEFCGRI
jgi:hypothetical protein